MPRPRKVVEGEQSPSLPASIRVLEDRTIAYGMGMITFTKDTVYTDPWYIYAAVSSDVQYELE